MHLETGIQEIEYGKLALKVNKKEKKKKNETVRTLLLIAYWKTVWYSTRVSSNFSQWRLIRENLLWFVVSLYFSSFNVVQMFPVEEEKKRPNTNCHKLYCARNWWITLIQLFFHTHILLILQIFSTSLSNFKETTARKVFLAQEKRQEEEQSE